MLYLFRHGKSHANVARLVTGTPADPLTDDGLAQAAAMHRWLKQTDLRAQRFFTSNWLRAQQTAQCLFPDADWAIDFRLGETNAGSVANWPLDTFVEAYPDFHGNNGTCYPDGESHEALNRRVLEWLHELLDTTRMTEHVVVVAHSGPIACLVQHVLGIGMDRFPALLPAHASLTAIEFADDARRRAIVKTFSLTPAETAGPMLNPARR
nr:histidine phosphatase family protein [Burkholderia mayonis]